MKDKVQIVLWSGQGWIGRIIKWQTRSKWSHAGILLPDGTVIEAKEFSGVQWVANPDMENAVVFDVDGLTEEQSADIIQVGKDFQGKVYDYLAVFRFLSRRKMTNNHKWFCSELVYYLFRRAGIHLLHSSVEDWEVSPGLLSMSPYLREVPRGS